MQPIGDLIEALPEPKRSSIIKLKHFLAALRKIRPPSKNGDIFVGEADANGIARLQMFVREGVYEAQTIVIECPILHWDYRRFVARLADEWAAMHHGLFLKTFAPDLYNGEVSPVQITEASTVKSMDLM